MQNVKFHSTTIVPYNPSQINKAAKKVTKQNLQNKEEIIIKIGKKMVN